MTPRLYLDCDGVLADFDSAIIDHFGEPPPRPEERLGSEAFWQAVRSIPGFYRNLPLMPDAKKLFAAVEHLRPIILTGCPLGGWAQPQKIAWAVEHFPGTPMITCASRDKRVYCKPGDVLIDDRPHYSRLWAEAGGIFIQHYSAEKSIAQFWDQVDWAWEY